MWTDLPKGKGPGHWEPQLVDEFGDHPRWSALVWCPVCKRAMTAFNHTISETGEVYPSFGHPSEYMPCPWHPTLRLLEWATLPPPPLPRAIETCFNCGARTRNLGGWSLCGNH